MLTFVIFLSAHTLSIFYRSALAVVAPEIGADVGAALSDLGRANAAWFFAFAIAQLPVGWALDQLGPRRTVGCLMTLGGLGGIAFALAQAPWQLSASMAVIGFGCSAAMMAAAYTFGRMFDASMFARRMSWLLGLSTLGGLLAATPLSTAVLYLGWRPTFLIVGVLTILSGVLALLIIVDPPKLDVAAATGVPATPGFVAGVKAALSLRALWPILPIVGVSYAVVAVERGLWSGPYFTEVHGLGTIARGNAVLLMAIAMSIGAFVFGELDRVTGQRKRLIISGSVMTAGAFLTLGLVGDLGLVAAISLFAIIGAAGFTYGLLLAHGRSFLPEHLLGRGLTLLNLAFISGAGLLQFLSSQAVAAMQAQKLQPVEMFARLHMAFGVALLAVTVIYLFAREHPSDKAK